MTLENLYHHEHGGEPERRFGRSGAGLFDFSVNISPLSPSLPKAALDALPLHRYPSIDGKGVKGFYCGRYGLDGDTVLPLNGAIEGIYLVPRALKAKHAMVFTPSFFDYERACRVAGATVSSLRFEEKERFVLPGIDVISKAIRDVDLLYVANPNNPTGTRFPKELFFALASRHPEKWFVMDEAFIQFTDDFPDSSLMEDVKAFKNIIVIHSLTKFYALPGLRLGAVVAHPEIIMHLLCYKEPWTVNVVAETVANELLHCRDYEEKVRLLIREEREKVFRQIRTIPEIALKGHGANFFLLQWNAGSDLDDLLGYLVQKGIYVRDCRNFPGLDDNYFRISVKMPQENDYLLQQLMQARQVGEVSP